MSLFSSLDLSHPPPFLSIPIPMEIINTNNSNGSNKQRNTCKLCHRRFASGRALAGHMRTHSTTNSHRRPPKPPSTDDLELSSVVENIEADAESETESSTATPLVNEPACSDEELALCLVMLSRDVWSTREDRERHVAARRRHVCGTCRRVFRSYQALGGHRASHHKSNPCSAVVRAVSVSSNRHVCPFCYRVFGSGQALGGHKRSHFVNGRAVVGVRERLIDLNLPATVEECESYVEDSALSDAER